jgi:peptidoglycan/LPS O-acetylase OafA/YrhL
VYPTYWVFLTLFIAAALAGFGYISFTVDWGNLASAYGLVRFVDSPTLPLKVAWTLMFEVFFYGMFALLIVNRWLGIIALAGWLAVIGIASAQGSLEMNWTSAWNVNFFFGAVAYWAYGRVDARWGSLLLTAGVALLIGLLVLNPAYDSIEEQQAYPVSLALLGLPFMLILLGGALWERHRGFVPPKLFLLLGEASYAIYLVHSAVISAICLLYSRLAFGLLPQPVLFYLIFLAATAAGLAAHWIVERPLLRASRKVPKLGMSWGAALRSTRTASARP